MPALIITIGMLFALPISADPPPTKVTLKTVSERRVLLLDQAGQADGGSGIVLRLHVDGPLAQDARMYRVLVTEAIDDAGTDLTKGAKPPMPREVERTKDGPPGDVAAPWLPGFYASLELPTIAARGARTIERVTGSIEIIVGGERKDVRVDSIKDNIGKAIEDPTLQSMGTTIELVAGKTAPPSLIAVISGNVSAISNVWLQRRISTKARFDVTVQWTDGPGRRTVTFQGRGLTDDTTLRIAAWPGARTVTLPLELNGVALP